MTVSIPCWVFSPPRPSAFSTRNRASTVFQSRAGFSLRRDQLSNQIDAPYCQRFNPVLGFLSAATARVSLS